MMTASVAALLLLAAGQPAPDFAVDTVDGKRLDISSLRGKKVLVFMWASW